MKSRARSAVYRDVTFPKFWEHPPRDWCLIRYAKALENSFAVYRA
jgi:hypothetical protein